MPDDNDKICYCCLGLALGYILFASATQGNSSEIDKPKCNHTVEKVVKSKKSRNFLLKQIENYQRNISPRIKEDLGKDRLCRFTPSCSEYARQAIEEYGSFKGSLMATKRLIKCNPLSKGGYDPVKKG